MLEIRTLGHFEVRFDGSNIEIPTRPAQSLLAYLALNAGLTFRRERLAGMLWPDSTEENARGYLRHALWRIRRSLDQTSPTSGTFLHVEDIHLGFNADSPYQLDAQILLERREENGWSRSELAQAVDLYRGELLPGFYDEWVILERERLNAAFDHKMQLLIEELIHVQDWGEVLDRSEAWIAFGRVPEPAYRALMIAHAGMGNLAQFAAAYRRLEATLDRELGLAPSAEMKVLHQQLAEGATKIEVLGSRRQAEPESEGNPPEPGEPPYKGLAYFDVDDAGLFFGREELITELTRRLEDHPFLALIVGPSGSGKSSLVRAGLIPALKAGRRDWLFHLLTPTAQPLASLAASLTCQPATAPETRALVEDMARDSQGLHGLIRHNLAERDASRLVIVVDQFEELFTLCEDPTERLAFIDNLLSAADPAKREPTLVIIALRADFYAHCAAYPQLRKALARHQEFIGTMSMRELRRAIEKPAKTGGWRIQSGLVDLIIKDVKGEPGVLPLLSHALLETWRRRSGRTLTLRGYAKAGGVRRAIARTADTVYNKVLDEKQRTLARNIFLRLTEFGEGVAETRRRATLTELQLSPKATEETREVLHILADARLIILYEDTVEVAHEALIREWPALRQWLAEDRAGLLLHRHLTESALEWERMGRDPGELYRGVRLAQALEWAEHHPDRLNSLERSFLVDSKGHADREERQREARRQRELEAAQKLAQAESRRAEEQVLNSRRLRRRAYYLVSTLVLTAVIALAALFLGAQARRSAVTAQYENRLGFARELLANAAVNLEVDPQLSLLLVLEAASVSQDAGVLALPGIEDGLRRALQASSLEQVLHAHTSGWPVKVSFSPDGRRIATSREGEGTRVWDLNSGEITLALDGVYVGYTPDGGRLATRAQGGFLNLEGVVQIWDLASGDELPLPGRFESAEGMALSPDGQRLVTTMDHGSSAWLWDLYGSDEPLTLFGHSSWLMFVQFSLDGTRLVTASDDGTARIWDAATGQSLLTLSGHSSVVTEAVFSPDGTRVGTASLDGTARLWDASSGELLAELRGHVAGVRTLDFSPDGERVATGGDDHKIKVWQAATGRELFTLTGHTGPVSSVQISPDGVRLASGAEDGTVRIWTIIQGREWLALPTPGNEGRIAFSPDGNWLAAPSGTQGGAAAWEIATGREVFRIPDGSHEGPVQSLAFSPDGGAIATGGQDQIVKVWDIPSKTGVGAWLPILQLSGHEDWITDIAFSQDGRVLASTSFDRSLRLWNLESALVGMSQGTSQILPVFTLTSPLPLAAVDFSEASGRLSVANHLVARVWDISGDPGLASLSDIQSLVLRRHTDAIQDLAFSIDGRYLATASLDSTAILWDIDGPPDAGIAAGRIPVILSGHAGPVTAIAFRPDESHLATAGRDGTIRIWAIPGGDEIFILTAGQQGSTSLAFSPDGRYLASAGGDAVRVYLTHMDDLLALARERVHRALTLEECQHYLHRPLEVCAEDA